MSAEIHFFHCGDGDTILVRGGDEWGLVDANFVKYLEVRERVERVLKGVNRLRFVCITHFDLDHIRGLASFLEERFCDKGAAGKPHLRVDQIIQPLSPVRLRLVGWKLKQAGERFATAMRSSGDGTTRFAEEAGALMDLLIPAAESSYGLNGEVKGLPEFPNLSPGTYLRGPKMLGQTIGMGPWMLAALGPDSDTAERYTAQVDNAFGAGLPLRDVFSRVESNTASRVLALLHVGSRETVLLTGDSTPEQIEAALDAWRTLNEATGMGAMHFDRVKVSHHGADSCHCPSLYRDHCRSRISRAVICASDDGRHHPHLTVIRTLKTRKIKYRVTGAKRSPPPAPTMPCAPLGVPTTPNLTDIILRFPNDSSWGGGGRLSRLH